MNIKSQKCTRKGLNIILDIFDNISMGHSDAQGSALRTTLYSVLITEVGCLNNHPYREDLGNCKLSGFDHSNPKNTLKP
jgi:hypothetical protein